MGVTWYLLQYTADLRKHEPKNMGVLVEAPDGWHMRFAGLRPDGTLDARKLRAFQVDKGVYMSWVEYYQRRALKDRWGDVITYQQRRGGNFRVIKAGIHLKHEDNWELFTEVLFSDLVHQPTSGGHSILDTVEEILSKAMVSAQPEVEVPGKWNPADPEPVMLHFDYGVDANSYHLLEIVSSQQASILGLKAKIDAVTRVEPSTKLVTFLSFKTYKTERALDAALRPLEAVARPIDVDEVDAAADHLREVLAD